jgi:S-DNA-T family DNA segregation ATPase FtsK/SpoIIIE
MKKYKDNNITLYSKFRNYTWGNFWFVFASILFIAIFSYISDDVCFNVISTNTKIHNYLGKAGANISDLLLQLLGEVAFLLPFIFLIFSLNFFTNRNVYPRWQKYFSFIGFLFTGSILFEGGVLGDYLTTEFYYVPDEILILLSILLFFICFTILADLRKNKWIVWSAKFYRKFKLIIGIFFTERFKEKIRRFFVKKNKYIVVDQENEIKNNKKLLKKKRNKKEIVEEEVSEKPNINIMPVSLNYVLPKNELLQNSSTKNKIDISKLDIKEQSEKLIKVLKDFKVEGKILSVKVGPIITLYEFEPSSGTKSSRIISLADDIARSMSAVSTRISVMPGKNALGIELPNKERETIYIKSLLESPEYINSKDALAMVIGTDIAGNAVVSDLTKMPHLLVAGTTGSGKSVGINTMIISLLYKLPPDKCKFIMIDPKMLELSVYEGIPHLLTPVVTEPTKAIVALKWVCREMEERYKIMAGLGVRNIAGYNEKLHESRKNGLRLTRKIQVGFDDNANEPIYEETEIEQKEMPYIVVIVDEMADLMITAGKEIEASIQRIAQKARAAGIHIIMATQRPSVDVITGVIKANFPTRISFQVVSAVDSRTILGEQGAEQLLGMGDMLFMAGGGKVIRSHGPFVSDGEVEKITNFIRGQGIKPNYVDEVLKNVDEDDDEGQFMDGEKIDEKDLYQQALHIVKHERKCSISYIQRSLRIGYNKAANLVEEMERNGILSSPSNTGKREILIEEN